MSDNDKLTIESFLEMMAAERGAARNTLEAYKRDLNDASAFLQRRKSNFKVADKALLEAYATQLGSIGLAARTVARKLSSLKQFYHFLYSDDIRTDNPATALDMPRLPKTLPKTLRQGRYRTAD